jgi:hypothetical protein
MHGRRGARAASLVAAALCALAAHGARAANRLTDDVIPLDKSIQRPRSLFELGGPFLDTGPMGQGVELPTGWVVQPQFLLFGTYRTAMQTFDRGKPERETEWANRLDVFGNLQLSGTERILVGFRPLDKNNNYLGREWEPQARWRKNADGNVEMAFFEGDIGQMFAKLDPHDRYHLDYGFSAGKQPLLMQDGLLLNDIIDSVGVVRNSLHTPWTSGLRLNLFWGWGGINRGSGDNQKDKSARLYAGEAFADFFWGSIDLDAAYITAKERTGDGFYGGAGMVTRGAVFGEMVNWTLRVVGSKAIHHETAVDGSGALIFSEVGHTLASTLDYVYLNSFVAPGRFTSAARGPDKGGPLGRMGILFEAFELGRYGAALGSNAHDDAGAALGYQRFFSAFRRQIVIEFGGREAIAGGPRGALALGGKFQQAIGSHFLVELDSFAAAQRNLPPSYGGRGEFVVKF